jgi:hypothetical protein
MREQKNKNHSPEGNTMTQTEKNRIIASIENSSLSSKHSAEVVALFLALCAKEELEDLEEEAWNPYTDACYAQQDKEDREMAQLQALAGWHHVQEAPAARNTVQRCQAPSLKGAATAMSLN